MINALHLLWIIPLSVFFGYMLCALFVMARDNDEQHKYPAADSAVEPTNQTSFRDGKSNRESVMPVPEEMLNERIKGEIRMNRVGEFEKVSYEQFHEAMKELFYAECDESVIREAYTALELPKRATSGSAGYDFKAPFSFCLEPGKTIKIPTGIRVKIENGWWLGCLPRSGLGFKYRLQLNNTLGVIDSDYYYSDNEGHIFAKITNDSNEDKILEVSAGDGFIQAIFIPYGITYSDEADGIRNGGMGSTDATK